MKKYGLKPKWCILRFGRSELRGSERDWPVSRVVKGRSRRIKLRNTLTLRTEWAGSSGEKHNICTFSKSLLCCPNGKIWQDKRRPQAAGWGRVDGSVYVLLRHYTVYLNKLGRKKTENRKIAHLLLLPQRVNRCPKHAVYTEYIEMKVIIIVLGEEKASHRVYKYIFFYICALTCSINYIIDYTVFGISN